MSFVANNMKELEKLINQKINKALATNVEKVARNTLKEHVIHDVYDAYSPETYVRTGGLIQDRNIETKMEDDNTLSIHSTRNEDGRDIASIIEYGHGYSARGLDEHIGARPFTEETAKELEKGLAAKALKEGLKQQGLDVL